LVPFQEFAKRVAKSKQNFVDFIKAAKTDGKTVAALGASTKGNVLLQYCGMTENDISYVGEVNVEKFGCFTPGTWLPIIPESELLAKKIDYLVVLPWHFRAFFENSKTLSSSNLVFPLPELSVRKAK
jgi:NDP-4-keto-2,6-dideoxyhexose 3-C-methyltransferase